MPVTAGVIRDQRMAARGVLAACDVPAERRRATALDCTHHLQLVEAHMAVVGLTPSRAVIAEDVRDLQSWSSHGRRRYDAWSEVDDDGDLETASAVLARGRHHHTRSAVPSTIAATASGPLPVASRGGPCGPSIARCG